MEGSLFVTFVTTVLVSRRVCHYYIISDSLVTMYPHSGPNLLDVIAPPTMNKESIMALFKLMPGLDYCRENPLNGKFEAIRLCS